MKYAFSSPSRLRVSVVVAAVSMLVSACTAGPDEPSKGTYTLGFPSTAAAVATDTVQVLVFDVPSSEARVHLCGDLIQARARREALTPSAENAPVGTCALLAGASPIDVPYGEHAVLAVGLRNGSDFLVGCVIQTFGEGDAVLPITLSLADPSVGVPDTTCTSVSQYCAQQCP